MIKMNKSKFETAFKNIYRHTFKQISYDRRVLNNDLALLERFSNNSDLNISELANVARIINKLNIKDQLVLQRLQEASLPYLKNADELELRKISSAFVNDKISEEFAQELKNRYKHFNPEGCMNLTATKGTLSVRFYCWLYKQRRYYLSFFRFFGIVLK